MKKNKLDRNEEIKEMKQEEKKTVEGKKVKKAWVDGRTFIKGKRSLRFRRTKNFGFWLSGVLSSFVIFLAGIMVAVAVLPVSVYFGGREKSNQYISDNLSSKSILSNVQNAKDITLNDVPALKDLILTLAGTINGLLPVESELIVIDADKLEALSSQPLFGGETPAVSELFSCVKIVATMDSFGFDLGSIGDLDIMDEFEEISDDEALNAFLNEGTTVENPKIYYYDQSALMGNPGGDTFSAGGDSNDSDSKYARAFDDNGELCAELKNLSPDELKEVKFFYPALRQVPVTDLLSVFDVRFKALTVRSILESFGEEVDDENPIIKIVGNETISSLGSLSEDSIKLVDFIDPPSDDPESPDYDTNRQIYDILLDACPDKDSYDELTMADLTNLDMNGVKLSAVIDVEENQDLFDMLFDATGKEEVDGVKDYDSITIGDLSGEDFSLDNVKLSAVIDLPTEENDYANQDIYDMLFDATGKEEVDGVKDYDLIIIGDLSGDDFSLDNVKLSAVIDLPTEENDYANQEIYDVILGAVPSKNSYDEITIGDLSGDDFSLDNVKLSAVIDVEGNEDLYDILLDAIPDKNSYEEITIGDMSSFNMDNVKLVTVIEAPTSDDPEDGLAYSKNRKLYDILMDATGNSNTGYESYSVLTIADMNSFNMDNVKLSTVIEVSSNQKLFDVLFDATGKDSEEDDYDSITIKDMNDFNMDDVKLVTVIEAPTSDDPEDGLAYSKNRQLYDVLMDATENANTGYESYSVLTIADMNNFNMDKVRLSTVIEVSSNQKLFDVLFDATGKDPEEDDYDSITIKDMNDFEMDDVKLSTVLEVPTSANAYKNQKLYDVLRDATKKASNDAITIGDLNNFDMNNVKFSTIIESSDNKIIQGLLNSDDPDNPNDDVTVGNMDAKINALDVETVYDKHCFTDDKSKAAENATPYYLTIQVIGGKETKVYSKEGTGTKYYVAKDSGIWLFLEFMAEGTDYVTEDNPLATGSAERYVDKHLTIGQMDTNIGNISNEIMNATIHQLYECGMLENEYENIRGMQVVGVIDNLNNSLAGLDE